MIENNDFNFICCDQFRELLSEAGLRGISIIAANPEPFRFFLLQSRCVNKEPKVKGYVINDEYFEGSLYYVDENKAKLFFSSTMQGTVKFCPCCGQNLKSLIKNNVKQFDILAEKHKNLAINVY